MTHVHAGFKNGTTTYDCVLGGTVRACSRPITWSRWGERREASPSPTLLVPSTCPRHRPPPSPSSPVVGARMPRPWLPRLRLRALARLGRRHPLFAAYGAVVAQLQPQPRGERRRPVPCLSGPASARPPRLNPEAIKPRATGPQWLWAGRARDPFLTPPPNAEACGRPGRRRAKKPYHPAPAACMLHAGAGPTTC